MYKSQIIKPNPHKFKLINLLKPYEWQGMTYLYGSGCECGWFKKVGNLAAESLEGLDWDDISPLGNTITAESYWKQHANEVNNKKTVEPLTFGA